MDTKKLRQKILDLAIRGKLVPQDPNDEPASVLLERIRAEKEQLIKEGKIKRSKKSAASDTSHYENVPFEVPESWCWTTIGELFQLQAGKFIEAPQISTCKDATHIYPCYGGNGLRGYVESYNRDGLFPIIGRQGALCGNINIAEGKFYATEHALVVETFANIDIQLFVYFLIQLNLNQYATATAQPGLAVKTINEVPIPLPPINEQHRISMAIEKSLDTLSEIDQSKHAIRKSILQLKSRILDLAISGKLAAQDCSDEPALELLRRINPSFAPCDNRHYENLPETWEEVELGAICQLFDGKKITDKELVNLDVKYLRGSKEGDKLFSGKYVRKDALMILVDGENSGEVFITPHEGYQGSTFKQLRISSELNRDYVLSLIQHSRELLKDNKVGSAIPHLNKKLFKQIHVPIAPYNEQERIVQTVQTIMFKLDEILADL